MKFVQIAVAGNAMDGVMVLYALADNGTVWRLSNGHWDALPLPGEGEIIPPEKPRKLRRKKPEPVTIEGKARRKK